MTYRDKERRAFLSGSDWADSNIVSLAGDASTRSYFRLSRNARTALLMDAPPGTETVACPPCASARERKALGYNASARLAGNNLHAFIAITKALHAIGLSTPRIYQADPEQGFAIIEDLGDSLFASIANDPQTELTIYEHAVRSLAVIHKEPWTVEKFIGHSVLTYDHTAMLAETNLLAEWYWEHHTGVPPSSEAIQEANSLWQEYLHCLSAPKTLILRDFHAENLLWLPEREPIARTGMIDFQDGLIGHFSYDLVSLLEDARRDVSHDLAKKIFNLYTHEMGLTKTDREERELEYAVLGAQRNAKILGIFARLAKRDGKPRYLDLLPRVEEHFRRNLSHPALNALHTFYSQWLPNLS